MRKLVFAPYDPSRDEEAKELFAFYPHKDFQLLSMGVQKDRMAHYLAGTLADPNTQSICLRDNGRLMGLIALQALPWMSQHFGLRMYAVRHLLSRSDGPLEHARLLRFVMEELPEVDFLDCRVAVDDIYSAHALELCGFRYVGTEVFMGRHLANDVAPSLPAGIELDFCRPSERQEVLDIVEATHVHNRFAYDPMIHTAIAKSLYCRLVENCFRTDQFGVMVARSRKGVEGFITFKTSENFSRTVGIRAASLDFIGVRPERRNKGLGVALNHAALSHLGQNGAEFAAVRTLASNYPALQILSRSGFKVTSSSLHFHKWIHRPKSTARNVQPESANILKLAKSGGDSSTNYRQATGH
ncbi:GNAT family N-acetyltransferase [Desulfomonile tiedjei]|uniref:Acetyltransferase n=1 Tax=Desulfomonile tiedjei (strain ATCC 49306 / DSM 6799 / DCB-1) TaxID=706587 RepID=I4BZY4_DESTA|nr:GNAT family N-acetyltransferase [Desulfomonile tiedjei]AFM22875.1 acetyltransferase [Desulfomonile tiedjei DSM 6799]